VVQISLSPEEFEQVLEAVLNRILRLTIIMQRCEEHRIPPPEHVSINLSVLHEVERKLKEAKQ